MTDGVDDADGDDVKLRLAEGVALSLGDPLTVTLAVRLCDGVFVDDAVVDEL